MPRTYSPFFVPVYGQVAGFRGLHDSYPDRVRDVVTMVIVTPPEFEATARRTSSTGRPSAAST